MTSAVDPSGVFHVNTLKAELISEHTRAETAESRATAAEARVALLEGEVADLKSDVVAFCVVWAVPYAKDRGLPPGHLMPEHYDILERCGARMDDFTRARI